MKKRLVLVAIGLYLFLCCHAEEEEQCRKGIDYWYETSDYGDHCTLEALGIFQKDNPITNNKLCCEGERHLHDTEEGPGFRSCDNKTEAVGRFVCAGSINHTLLPEAPSLEECNDPCHLLFLNEGNLPI